MKKFQFPVGQKVKGYGVLNEYGEFDFIPEQSGTRAGRVRQVKSGNGYVLSQTNKRVIVHMNLERGESLPMIKRLMNIVSEIIQVFKDYDFRED